jgi:hypothetical protein
MNLKTKPGKQLKSVIKRLLLIVCLVYKAMYNMAYAKQERAWEILDILYFWL